MTRPTLTSVTQIIMMSSKVNPNLKEQSTYPIISYIKDFGRVIALIFLDTCFRITVGGFTPGATFHCRSWLINFHLDSKKIKGFLTKLFPFLHSLRFQNSIHFLISIVKTHSLLVRAHILRYRNYTVALNVFLYEYKDEGKLQSSA